MENLQKHQPHFWLLPNYFKKIGIGFVLFDYIILIPLAHYWEKFEFYRIGNYKDAYYVVFFDIFIIGLLLYSMAKEKIEDELITLIRLQSIAKAFVFGIIVVIIIPFIGCFVNGHIQEVKGQAIILFTLVSYIYQFYSMKKNM